MSFKDKQYLIKLPLLIRINLWLGSSKVLIYISQLILGVLFSGLIVVLLIVGYGYIESSPLIKLFSNPDFAGLFGTLIGVFVGAVIGGVISLQLQKEASRAASAIKDKEDIYKFLYDGLMKFRSDITQTKDRYHTYFTFEMSDPRIDTINSNFVEWDQIKNDSRIIQISPWLKKIFEQYFLSFSKYQDLLDFAIEEIVTIKKGLSKEVGLNYRIVEGLDDSYLLGLMNQSDFNLRHGLAFEEDGDLKGVNLKDIEKKVIDTCFRLTSVEQAKSFYDNVLVKNTDEIISILELVVKYINNKYENKDDVI